MEENEANSAAWSKALGALSFAGDCLPELELRAARSGEGGAVALEGEEW